MMALLALCVVLIVIGVVALVRFLGRPSGGEGGRPYPWTKVTGFDAKGKKVGQYWFEQAIPEVYENDGLAHLAPYVDRLVAFNGYKCFFVAGSLDGHKAVSLAKFCDVPTIGMHFKVKEDAALEAAVRDYFEGAGYPVENDYLGQGDSVRCIDWRLPNEKETLLRELLYVSTQFSGISPGEGLSIKFQDQKEAAPEIPGAVWTAFRMISGSRGRKR